MRTRINNITFTPGTRSINTGITDLTIDDIRLFINESQMKVICSSMQKENIDSIVSGVVTYKDTFPVLAVGDHITFEIDRGDDVAKETNATANKQAVLSAIEQAKITLQGNDQTATLAALKTAIAAIDMSDLAKEATLNSVGLDAAAAKIAAQSITGYALQGSDSTKSITTLDADLGDVAAALEYMEQSGMPQIAQIAKQGSNANASLSEVQTQATSAANDAAAAKTAAQSITGYALQGNVNTSTNTAIYAKLEELSNSAISYKNEIIHAIEEAVTPVIKTLPHYVYDEGILRLPYSETMSYVDVTDYVNQILKLGFHDQLVAQIKNCAEKYDTFVFLRKHYINEEDGTNEVYYQKINVLELLNYQPVTDLNSTAEWAGFIGNWNGKGFIYVELDFGMMYYALEYIIGVPIFDNENTPSSIYYVMKYPVDMEKLSAFPEIGYRNECDILTQNEI